jgi:hypothetical protein
MTTITTTTYKIAQKSKTNSYTLSIQNGSTHDIFKSISETNILSNVFFDDSSYNLEMIIFTATKVKSLSAILKEDKLTNQQVIKMIYDLSKQIAYLEINMMSFYGYNLDDVLVINDNTFFIASTKYLVNINAKDYNIYFFRPIDKPYFSSPELNEVIKLPAKIDYRASYYSLGALILFCSTNVYIFSELTKEQEESEDFFLEILSQSLEPIKYTKPYWFLKRCFYKDYKKRILLFI